MKTKSLSKKRVMIGSSIIAIVLLILGSLTNVVGYQSVKSTMNESPLFQTRTQRATNQQQNNLPSQYLGMDKESLWQFPIRDNQTEQLRKVMAIINKMDDKTFARFTELCIQKVRQDDTLRDLNRSQIVQALLVLKTNPDAIIKSYTNRNNQELPKTAWTYCGYTVCGNWTPGCWIVTIIMFIIFLFIVLPILFILNFFTLKWCPY